MSPLSGKAPWREVVHIEEKPHRRADRGGVWWLTLSCGHVTFRARPRPTFANKVAVTHGDKRVMARYSPPRKVRCYTCWGFSAHRALEERAAKSRTAKGQ